MRVKEPNDTYLKILVRMIKYLNGTNKNHPTLSADDLKVVKWYVDTSFAVRPDLKSHTRAIITMGKVVMQSVSYK